MNDQTEILSGSGACCMREKIYCKDIVSGGKHILLVGARFGALSRIKEVGRLRLLMLTAQPLRPLQDG